MNRVLMVLILVFGCIVSGCGSKEAPAFQEEKELLTNEIVELKELVNQQENKIDHLEKSNAEYRAKLGVLTEAIENVRSSAYARLEDHTNTFYNLKDVYKIHSNHMIKDDWYVIKDEYFQIELLGYEDAVKVEFFTLRMSSDQGPMLGFVDENPLDGWVYTNHKISEVINKQMQMGGLFLGADFVIYADVTLADGSLVRTSKLPIYNTQD